MIQKSKNILPRKFWHQHAREEKKKCVLGTVHASSFLCLVRNPDPGTHPGGRRVDLWPGPRRVTALLGLAERKWSVVVVFVFLVLGV